jgi:hypothetical protein
MIMRLSIILPLLGTLAACHAEKPDWAQQGRRQAVPAEACKAVEKAVAQLRAASGIEISNSGEATMPAAAWNGMPPAQHDQLVRTIAFHAACAAGTQSDAQPIVIRGDDGDELARRTISTRVDMGELLRD